MEAILRDDIYRYIEDMDWHPIEYVNPYKFHIEISEYKEIEDNISEDILEEDF